MSPTLFIQILLGGLLQGGIYALAAFGLSICFGVLNVLNVAHGEFLMLGAVIAYLVFKFLGFHPLLTGLVVLPLFLSVGFLFERLLLRPVKARTQHEFLIASILVTLGAALTIKDLTFFLLDQASISIPFSMPSLRLGGVIIPSIRLIILGAIIFLTFGVHLYLRQSYTGKAIRAITQDKEGAMVVGVDVSRIAMITFGIGTALAATAGSFYVILFVVDTTIGIPLTIKYLSIIVLGGLGSLVGSLAGGMILGLTEAIAAFYLGSHWAPASAFFLLLLILLIKPEGLFGHK
jgi:branched-chain amino acid transport system permease protein